MQVGGKLGLLHSLVNMNFWTSFPGSNLFDSTADRNKDMNNPLNGQNGSAIGIRVFGAHTRSSGHCDAIVCVGVCSVSVCVCARGRII